MITSGSAPSHALHAQALAVLSVCGALLHSEAGEFRYSTTGEANLLEYFSYVCHRLHTLLLLQGTEVWVHLGHPWCDCPYAVGDAANIIGGVASTDAQGRRCVFLSDGQGLLVLHPDVLLSGGWGGLD